MSTVQVLDKKFRVMMSEEQILKRIGEVAQQISKDFEGKDPLFLAVLNGSFIFAADLIRRISTPCEISFIRMASYSGMKSTGQVKQLIGLTEDIENRHVVVVEDIIDSGLTMQELLKMLSAHRPASVSVCSLLVKPGNIEVPDLQIDYRAFDIPNDFILGYGLDYNGYGRELRDIYVLAED